jgi:hypothetical protein
LGDLRISESLPPARVFGDDRETVAVLTAGTDAPRTAAAADLSVQRAEGLDGRKVQIAAGEIPLPDGLAYVWLDRASVAQRLDTKNEAMRLWQLGQASPPRRRSPSSIVLRWQIDPHSVKPETGGYRLVEESPGQARFTVRAFNLGEQPANFRLSLDFGDAAARVSSENPCAVRVPAAGFADAGWDVDLTEAFTRHDQVEATVRPVGEVPERTLPLAVTLIGEPTVAQGLARHPRHVRLPLGESARWQPNIPPHGRLSLDPQQDGSIRMNVSFMDGDRWVYPYFALPEDLDLSGFRALVLRARCERRATVRVLVWEGTRGVAYLTSKSVVPADGKWHAAEVRFEDLTLSGANAPDDNGRLDLAQVRRISLGMNSDVPENRLEISEAYLVGPMADAK